MDNFGINFIRYYILCQMQPSLRESHETKMGNSGYKYLDITLEWDYKNGCMDIYMMGYVEICDLF